MEVNTNPTHKVANNTHNPYNKNKQQITHPQPYNKPLTHMHPPQATHIPHINHKSCHTKYILIITSIITITYYTITNPHHQNPK